MNGFSLLFRNVQHYVSNGTRPTEYVASYEKLGEMLEAAAVLRNKSQDVVDVVMFEPNATSPTMQWQCVENRLTLTEIEQLKTFSFWVEGIVQCSLGLVGIISNLVAILVLSNSKMKTVFNKLLICLMCIHTVFISVVILNEMMWPTWDDKPTYLSGAFFMYLLTYILDPLQQILRYSSIFITAVMARHRFLSLRHPIAYRNSIKSLNPWKSAVRILILVVVVSLILTAPLVFETAVENTSIDSLHGLNQTHFKYVSIIKQNRNLII